MAKAFSIRDLMNDDIRQQESESDVFERVSVFDIQPNPKNEYELSEIEKMKDSIYALGGVQQNLVLVRFPRGAEYKYLALDGHRRRKASLELVEEGYPEFEFVPAVIKGQIDADTEDAVIVMMNSTQRNKTDWERVMEHMKLKEIIPKLKKRQGLDGRTREIESELLGVSQGQIAIYNTIGTCLSAELMELLKRECIGISLAYEAAKLEPDMQKQLAETANNTGSICEEDIKRLLGSRPIKGQMKMTEVENVTESDTFEKAQSESVHAPAAKKKEICYTTSECDVDIAIDFIFFMHDFPENKLHEIIDSFRGAENFTAASIAAELIFNGMLPYESHNVRVMRQGGYQIEYIHTGEIDNIPAYHFWKGFERKLGWKWKKESAEQADLTDDIEDVTESDTSEEYPTEVNKIVIDKKIALRGGYEPILIDDLINKYDAYLEILKDGQHLNPSLICKYNCLIDALESLKSRIMQEGMYDSGND